MQNAGQLYEARHLIGGRSVGEPELERRNPADPSDVVSRVALGGPAEVGEAITAAAEAQRGWAAQSAASRGSVLTEAGRLLLRRSDELAELLTREEGKTRGEARAEVMRSAAILDFYGAAVLQERGHVFDGATPGRLVYTLREPLGVVGVITPWNFPLAIPTWKVAPALAVGNSVVLKPATLTAATAMALAEALDQAGLPPGVLNVVHGDGSRVGAAIASAPEIGAVTFTGSTAVGVRVRQSAATRGARVLLEMGGKNATVVLDDADARRAAEIVAAGAFGLTGQACTATSRVLVTAGVRRAFIDELRTAAARYAPTNGLDPGAMMGPVVSEDQLANDIGFVERARASDAQAVLAGASAGGNLLGPSIFAGVDASHELATEEVFGPVLAVVDVSDLDEAIEVANASRYGLVAGVITKDLSSAMHFARSVQAGVVKVNQPTTGLELNVPFGGVKDSSSNTYREQGMAALDFSSWTRTVYIDA